MSFNDLKKIVMGVGFASLAVMGFGMVETLVYEQVRKIIG